MVWLGRQHRALVLGITPPVLGPELCCVWREAMAGEFACHSPPPKKHIPGPLASPGNDLQAQTQPAEQQPSPRHTASHSAPQERLLDSGHRFRALLHACLDSEAAHNLGTLNTGEPRLACPALLSRWRPLQEPHLEAWGTLGLFLVLARAGETSRVREDPQGVSMIWRAAGAGLPAPSRGSRSSEPGRWGARSCRPHPKSCLPHPPHVRQEKSGPQPSPHPQRLLAIIAHSDQ